MAQPNGLLPLLATFLYATAHTNIATAQTSPEEGDIRLVAREDINGYATGAVQVFLEGRWGAVCDDRFDDLDAAVACRQLGLGASGDASVRPFPPELVLAGGPEFDAVAEVPFVLDNLGCSGDEDFLIDCPAQPEPGNTGTGGRCTRFSSNFAFVACGITNGPEEGSVRLAGGATAEGGAAQFGRLEVFFRGGWGTVCFQDEAEGYYDEEGPQFTAGAVNVACRQLGFAEGVLQPLADPPGSGGAQVLSRVPVALAGADCSGNEANLASCGRATLQNVPTSECTHSDDVAILCFNGQSTGTDGSLRLMGGETGPNYQYGRLEIFLRGFWSNICSRTVFSPDSAALACKTLGFDGGSALEFPQAFRFQALNRVLLDDTIPVALADVDCDPDDASILGCRSRAGEIRSCGLRASDASGNTIVACVNTVAACSGQPTAQQGSARLIDGIGSPCDPMYSGIVEIFNDGQWGAVCAANEDAITADVVCRQLGFPHGNPIDGDGLAAPSSSDYADTAEESDVPSDVAWLFNVGCRGPEEELAECLESGDYEGFSDGTRQCRRRLHVSCRQFAVEGALEDGGTLADAEGDVRLADEREVDNWAIGNLEVYVGGSWRQVCAAAFDNRDADVACGQLGYGAGSVAPFFDAFERPGGEEYTTPFPDIGVTLPGCTGTEASLLECGAERPDFPFATNFQTIIGCQDNREPGLTLACVKAPLLGQEGAFRLVNGETNADVAYGVPQIFHAGAWGTLCDGDIFRYDYVEGSQYAGLSTFGDEAADLVCAELGYTAGFFRFGGSDTQEADLPPPWLGTSSCFDDDSSLPGCLGTFGDTAACGLTVELFCSNADARALDGEARLVAGGQEGNWEYGRLEFRDRGILVGLADLSFTEALGRRGALVACRQLGYPVGAEVVVGTTSALPGPAGVTDAVSAIKCQGTEASLGGCQVFRDNAFTFCPADDACNVALVCGNPLNCTSTPRRRNRTGDVRLVPFADTPGSSDCDVVHFGAVEVFNRGRWGAVCDGTSLVASVVCRQLGFLYGWLYDVLETVGEPYGYDYFDADDTRPSEFAWASEIACTGAEGRLSECRFPESRTTTLLGLPRGGVLDRCSRSLGVVCSQFDLVDTSVSP